MPFDFAARKLKVEVISEDDMDELNAISKLKSTHGFQARVEWDESKKVVLVGKMEITYYRQFKDLKKFISAMFTAHGINYSHWNPKWQAKAFTAVFGYSPSRMHKHMNGLLYKKFVVPYQDILAKVNFQRGRVAVSSLHDIQKNEALCREVYADGLYNILPIVASSGLHPSELKAKLGATWKLISNNSLHRNRELGRYIRSSGYFKSIVDNLEAHCHIPTTVLQKCSSLSLEAMQHVAAHYKGQWSKLGGKSQGFDRVMTKELREINTLVRDTMSLAVQLEAKFDPLWSPRKMKEKHDQYSRELTARKYSPAKIEWLASLPVANS